MLVTRYVRLAAQHCLLEGTQVILSNTIVWNFHLKNRIKTLPYYLKSVGYNTALVSKAAPLTSPLESGFDYFIGQIDQSACHNMYPYSIDHGDGKILELKLNQENKRSREACMANPSLYDYTVDLTHSRSSQWITSVQNDKNPVCVYMSGTVRMLVSFFIVPI